MLILIDQDGVIADFESGFCSAWRAAGHAYPVVPLHERRNFHVREDYPTDMRAHVEAIYTAPGFFRDLLPIEGAIDALGELLAIGHDLRICTSPLNNYRNCVLEKFEWVDRHLGSDFVQRMIITKDKTVVFGDVLIDDKPAVTGSRTPAWKHIVFDQPYNRNAGTVRMNWSNWREILMSFGAS